MKAIEINATTDNLGHLKIDYPINKPKKNVRVIILVEESNDYDENEAKWLSAINSNPAFNFLNEPDENIYTLKDGESIND